MASLEDSNLKKLLESNKQQFIIPIYQRGYNWTTDDVKKLIDDLLEFYKYFFRDNENKYFIGNIVLKVLKKEDRSELIEKSVVVDGQQRITTTLLIFKAIYEINRTSFPELQDMFHLKEKDKEKIKIDRLEDSGTLLNLLNNNLNEKDKETNIYKNYNYIYQMIKNQDITNDLYNALSQTLLVIIRLSDKENENKVFETINCSGKPLSESDLIKNHIFFFSHNWSNQEDEMIKYYEKILNLIDKKDYDEFFRFFSVIFNEDKVLPSSKKIRDIFNKFKDSLLENNLNLDNQKSEDVWELIYKIEKIAKIWNLLYYSKADNNVDDFLLNVVRSNMKTYFTLISDLILEFNIEFDPIINKKIIRIIAKLSIFRSIIDKPDKNITRDVPFIVQNFKKDSKDTTLEGFEEWLETTKRVIHFPSLEEMKANSSTNPIYDKNKKKANNVLRAYELSICQNGTAIDYSQKLTIEHVMPQKFKQHWFKKIDYAKEIEKNRFVHTLGNLTLLTESLNSGLSNKEFKFKLKGNDNNKGIKDDALYMNREFFEFEKWDIKEIQQRTNQIVESIYTWFNREYT